jgi:excinuclease UvrABC helicase subunit UvrB
MSLETLPITLHGKQMLEAADNLNFEKAAEIRDTINELKM